MVTQERYIVDAEGHRVAVVLDTAEYERLLQELVELEELRERQEMLNPNRTHDPDEGLTLKKEFVESLLKQEAAYKAGKWKGKSLEQVAQELGLDEDV